MTAKTHYLLRVARLGHPAGTRVYEQRFHDYGLARDDTQETGVAHMTVTLRSDGGYPGFTVPVTDLVPVPVPAEAAA